MKFYIVIFNLLLSLSCIAQADTTKERNATITDSSNVTITAFEMNKRQEQVAASVQLLSIQALQKNGLLNILDAVNTLPGVIMEERSPGSYRINIRGSALRAPFGVRNTKVLYNNYSLTDAGGDTYVNQLDFRMFDNIEVLKSIAGSVYGAGVGGSFILNNQTNYQQQTINTGLSFGSFNTKDGYIKLTLPNKQKNLSQRFFISQFQTDGWRNQTAMKRQLFNWELNYKPNKTQQLQTTVIAGKHFYETPGGLTLEQFTSNARQARPAAGIFPSAEEANAFIERKMIFAGISHQLQIWPAFKNTTSISGTIGSFNNPNIRLYENRQEPFATFKTVFENNFKRPDYSLQWHYGLEYIAGSYKNKTYENIGGNKGTFQSQDNLKNSMLTAFIQTGITLKHDWQLLLAGSFNKVSFKNQTVFPEITPLIKKHYNAEWVPKVSVLKAICGLNIFASYSKGFSSPTTSEVLIGNAGFNEQLQAQYAHMYELGLKQRDYNNRFYWSAIAFITNGRNTIVQGRDDAGIETYINSGRTKQTGIELNVNYKITENKNYQLQTQMSYTFSQFQYDDYKINEDNFSGLLMPGVPRHRTYIGIHQRLLNKLDINLNGYFNGKLMLNDANTAVAKNYELINLYTAYSFILPKNYLLKLYCSVNNILNQTYSLGNDINAAGNRFYNAAPERQLIAGLQFTL